MLIHADSFNSYASASDYGQQYNSYSYVGLSTNGGRFGGGSLALTSYSSNLTWTYPAGGLSSIWTGFAIQLYNSTPQSGVLIQFESAYGTEVIIQYNPLYGVWRVVSGTGSVLYAMAYAMSANTWHWVDIYFHLSGSGNVALWLDNVKVFNFSGNTAPFFISTFSTITIGSSGDSIYECYIDDWYVLTTTGPNNTTRLGDSQIDSLLPTSDAGPNNGTPSTAGDHYLMVDEQQWSTSNSILIENTLGQEELFGMQQLTQSPSLIHGVQVLTIVNKDNSGIMYGNTVVQSNSITIDSSSVSLSTAYTILSGIYETDPSTSDAWTSYGINNMDCGFKVY
jgi:hypothetical protein